MDIINIKQPEGGLLQSEEWVNVLLAEKGDVWKVKNLDKKLYCTNYKLPIVGKYGYCPRAYCLEEKDFNQILEQAKDKKLGWIRFDLKDRELVKKINKNHNIKKSPHNMQPKQNFIIDLRSSDEELLAKMKGKTRYNIRLAKKRGVEILITREQKYIYQFIDLVDQTAKRKGISFHEEKHYLQMFKNIPENILQLYIAKYKGHIIAANIISFYGGTATYLHGATSDKYKNVMAPFLLQWQAIKDAKNKNCNWYDFGGVFLYSEDPGKKGITRFKIGFSPKTKIFETSGSYDVILSEVKYKTYRILQKIKSK